jgi:tetratricopeptide (TPR) repeat protein
MRYRSWKTLLPVFGLCAIGGMSIGNVIINAPAFTPQLRTQSVFGDWRVVAPASLYHKSDYYFDLAYGYLRGDIADFLVDDTSFSSDDIYQARLERAAELLNLSLSSSPSRAKTWSALAATYALLGQSDDAIDALRSSWRLAPNSLSEAPERLFVVGLLNDQIGTTWQQNTERQAIISDIRIVRRYNPRLLDTL